MKRDARYRRLGMAIAFCWRNVTRSKMGLVMKNFGIAAVLALSALFVNPSAEAAPIKYNINGTFQNSTYYTGAADGGSFSGSFTLSSGLPITPANTLYSYLYLNSFDVALKDALGHTVFTFKSGVGGATGYLSAAYENMYEMADYLSFYDGKGDNLFLLLPAGFTGSGAIIPSSHGYVSDMLFGGSLHNQVNLVASGSVVPAPEPSTAPLFLAAACGGLFLMRRKRRTAVA